MKAKNKKILILFSGILLSAIILPIVAFGSGSESIKIELSATQLSPVIGEETEFIVTVKNELTKNITNIKVIVSASGKNICNETVASLIPGATDTVSCKWIPDDCNLGESYAVRASAKSENASATSEPVYVTVTGKMYDIEIPENPTVNKEITITVKDAEGLTIDDAKIKIKFNENFIDNGTVKNGIFKFTPTEEGTYTIFVEKVMDEYCRVNKKEVEVKNSFIVQSLKTQYGIDEDLDIKITDSNDNIIDKVNVIVSGPLSREFTTTNGNLKFKLKDKGFEKGEYFIIFQEYKANPGDPSLFWELTEKFVVSDEPLPETEPEPWEEPEEEPEQEPEEKPESVESNISEIPAPESGPEIITTPVQKETFFEKYWLWILILVVIIIALIIVFMIIRKKQTPEKKQKYGGLRDL